MSSLLRLLRYSVQITQSNESIDLHSKRKFPDAIKLLGCENFTDQEKHWPKTVSTDGETNMFSTSSKYERLFFRSQFYLIFKALVIFLKEVPQDLTNIF